MSINNETYKMEISVTLIFLSIEQSYVGI